MAAIWSRSAVFPLPRGPQKRMPRGGVRPDASSLSLRVETSSFAVPSGEQRRRSPGARPKRIDPARRRLHGLSQSRALTAWSDSGIGPASPSIPHGLDVGTAEEPRIGSDQTEPEHLGGGNDESVGWILVAEADPAAGGGDLEVEWRFADRWHRVT